MAGRPKRKEDLIKLDQVPQEQIIVMLEEGKSITRVCMALGVGRTAMNVWLSKPENVELVSRARVRAADLMVSDALDIADSATIEEVNLAKLRIQTRHWTAERWNAPAYAQQKGQQVSINVQGMRMDALRHVEVLEDLSTPKLST